MARSASGVAVLPGVMRVRVRSLQALRHRRLQAYDPSVWIANVCLQHVPVLWRERHDELRLAIRRECRGIRDPEDRMCLELAFVLLRDEHVGTTGGVRPLPGPVVGLEDVL